MATHKRIKALPVCSKTLREKCAVFKGCGSGYNCDECPAAELEKQAFYCGNELICEVEGTECGCACNRITGHGCPYFRKAGDK